MAALTVRCINPRPYQRPPRITIPNLGVLEQAWDMIDGIPDPMDIVAKFMDKINLAMMPLKKYLQLVEGIVAIKQCVEAIPKAILWLSPTPIFDCLKALARVIAPIIQDIPPIPYIQAAMDIMAYAIDLIDAIIDLFTALDTKLSRLFDLRVYAQALGDIDLVNFSNCGLKDITLTMQQIMDLLRYVQPLVSILLSVILRLLPTPAAQRAADDLLETALTFGETQDLLADVDITVTGLPDLGAFFLALGSMRKILVQIYNIIAPIIGEDADKTDRTIPTFTHF